MSELDQCSSENEALLSGLGWFYVQGTRSFYFEGMVSITDATPGRPQALHKSLHTLWPLWRQDVFVVKTNILADNNILIPNILIFNIFHQ